jgi:hypothetical protein
MSQLQIQEKIEQGDRMVVKAKAIARARHVSRIDRNVWTVKSQSQRDEKNFYVVTFDTALDAFMCTCKAFEFSTGICKHVLACAFFEGGYGEK